MGGINTILKSGDLISGIPAYFCRAWVNFNGTGTVAIRGSGNVSSITDNGVGNYTINLATAMPDANYAFSGSALDNGSSNSITVSTFTGATYTPTSLQIQTQNGASRVDFVTVNVALFH